MSDSSFDFCDDEFVLVSGDRPHSSGSEPVDTVAELCIQASLNDSTNQTKITGDIGLTLNQVEADTVLLTLNPRDGSNTDSARAGCDIVLAIDISGSMKSPAEIPDQAGLEHKERSGLSILDLVKHSCRAVLHSLQSKDRLAIVAFSTTATVVQGLRPMTDRAKKETLSKLDGLQVQTATNLWAGLRTGLDIFASSTQIGNVQSLLLLTDGVPNHMCPVQGYIPKLTSVLSELENQIGQAPTISCFGFGYSLRSGLLRSIAEVGNGKFAYIPDAGMIVTVFVNAIAGLFSTVATRCIVSLEASDLDCDVTTPSYLRSDVTKVTSGPDTICFGNIQYGHPRHVVLKLRSKSNRTRCVGKLTATLSYVTKTGSLPCQTSAEVNLGQTASGSIHSWPYQLCRHELCEFIDSLSAQRADGEYYPLTKRKEELIQAHAARLKNLTDTIQRTMKFKLPDGQDSSQVEALLRDIVSTDPTDPHSGGQVTLALCDEDQPEDHDNTWAYRGKRYFRKAALKSFYEKWGIHYLPSLLHAHMRESCTTFKDAGPMLYGVSAPMFLRLRDQLDQAFDMIPPPVPSLAISEGTTQQLCMRRYHSVDNPCFVGHCLIRLDGGNVCKVEDLAPGELVWTPLGPRRVQEILVTDVTNTGGARLVDMFSEGKLELTEWHPVKIDNVWVFPAQFSQSTPIQCTEKIMAHGHVYSLLLEASSEPDAHSVEIGGCTTVTLGHGIDRTCPDDVRGHPFFGNHEQVRASTQNLDTDSKGRRLCGGIARAFSYATDQTLAYKFVKQ